MTQRLEIRAQGDFIDYRDKERARGADRTGILGTQTGVIDVPSRANYVYVRLDSDPRKLVQALAPNSIQKVADLPVAIKRVWSEGAPRWVVSGRAYGSAYPSDPMSGTVGSHASQHVRADLGTGGFDPVEVYNRALIQARGQAQATPNMTVYVTAGKYIVDGTGHVWAGGSTGAFVAPADHRCDLVYLGNDHALHVATGVDGISPAARPAMPNNVFPLVWVWLDSTNTTITETCLEDARLIGGQTFTTGAAGNHDLLDGSVAQDTVAHTVTEGALIVGNATPKWDGLAISVPAANVRNVVGVDNGETQPSWKTALDATNPTTIAAGDAAAPGTSLVFSHRDHRHGSPATWTATAHKLDSLVVHDTADDNTNHDASVARHGLLPKLSGDSNQILRGDGTWGDWTPAGWEQKLDNSPGSHVMCFANLGGGIIIAGADDNTPSGAGWGIVRRSLDGGHTWGADIHLDDHNLVDSLCNVGGGVVLAGLDAPGKIYRSTNSGATWSNIVQLDTEGVYCIVKLSDGSIVAGTCPNGKIYRSTDGGLNWTQQYTYAGSCIYSLVDLGGGVVLAGSGWNSTTGYIHKSTDFGQNWVRKSQIDTYGVLSLAYDGTTVYAGTGGTNAVSDPGKVYLSVDAGESWDAGHLLDGMSIWSMTVLDTDEVIAGTMDNWDTGTVNGGNIYRSADGTTWTLWKNFPGYVNGLIETGSGHPLAGISGWYTSPSSIWAYFGGSTDVPTGTGFRHVTAGIEDAAAKLVENADVAAAAAIVESKLSLNYATHSSANDPSTSQKAALAGTNGTPSGTNKYVTDSDPRMVGELLMQDGVTAPPVPIENEAQDDWLYSG